MHVFRIYNSAFLQALFVYLKIHGVPRQVSRQVKFLIAPPGAQYIGPVLRPDHGPHTGCAVKDRHFVPCFQGMPVDHCRLHNYSIGRPGSAESEIGWFRTFFFGNIPGCRR